MTTDAKSAIRFNAAWVLGACTCEPMYEHCARCDARRVLRAAAAQTPALASALASELEAENARLAKRCAELEDGIAEARRLAAGAVHKAGEACDAAQKRNEEIAKLRDALDREKRTVVALVDRCESAERAAFEYRERAEQERDEPRGRRQAVAELQKQHDDDVFERGLRALEAGVLTPRKSAASGAELAERHGLRAASGGEALGRDLGHVDAVATTLPPVNDEDERMVDRMMAASRSGANRRLSPDESAAEIATLRERAEAAERYGESQRERADSSRASWEHGVLVRAEAEKERDAFRARAEAAERDLADVRREIEIVCTTEPDPSGAGSADATVRCAEELALDHAHAMASSIRAEADRDRYRAALESIAAWDMLNPPDPSKLADATWLRTLVDGALASGEVDSPQPQRPPSR
jgi:hypothetical protein